MRGGWLGSWGWLAKPASSLRERGHVLNPGEQREASFGDHTAQERFLPTLGEVWGRTCWRVLQPNRAMKVPRIAPIFEECGCTVERSGG